MYFTFSSGGMVICPAKETHGAGNSLWRMCRGNGILSFHSDILLVPGIVSEPVSVRMLFYVAFLICVIFIFHDFLIVYIIVRFICNCMVRINNILQGNRFHFFFGCFLDFIIISLQRRLDVDAYAAFRVCVGVKV